MEAMTRAELEAILEALMALDPEAAGWPEARIDLHCSLWNRAGGIIVKLCAPEMLITCRCGRKPAPLNQPPTAPHRGWGDAVQGRKPTPRCLNSARGVLCTHQKYIS